MHQLLYLWREQREIQLSPSDIQRQVDAGEDVDGLADLAIREMLDRLKLEFAGGKESAGLFAWQAAAESLRASWAWQFMRFELDQLSDEHRDKLFDLARQFGCTVFDPQMNLKME
jgi:hypothetical protein